LTGYSAITDWLAEKLAYARGGSTLTTPFTGLYISKTRADVICDDVHVLFCDFDLDADNPDHLKELLSYLNELRMLLIEALNEEEIWIVFHQVTRIIVV
jgi:hypothetical protein